MAGRQIDDITPLNTCTQQFHFLLLRPQKNPLHPFQLSVTAWNWLILKVHVNFFLVGESVGTFHFKWLPDLIWKHRRFSLRKCKIILKKTVRKLRRNHEMMKGLNEALVERTIYACIFLSGLVTLAKENKHDRAVLMTNKTQLQSERTVESAPADTSQTHMIYLHLKSLIDAPVSFSPHAHLINLHSFPEPHMQGNWFKLL